jgi:hypothetical protein
MTTARRRRDGLTSFLRDLPQRVDLQLLVGHDPLQAGVLPLEILQPLRVVGLHAAELVPPPVIGLLGHLQVPGDIGDLRALSQEPVGLPELADDLLRRVPTSSHRDEPPSPNQCWATSSHNGRTELKGSGQADVLPGVGQGPGGLRRRLTAQGASRLPWNARRD